MLCEQQSNKVKFHNPYLTAHFEVKNRKYNKTGWNAK